jgi:GNAT superfamily N-acetyltransferase
LITIREATTEDIAQCVAITATYTTRFAWQVTLAGNPNRYDRHAEGDAHVSYHLQQVRLPKSRVLRLPSSLTPLETIWERYAARFVALDDDGFAGYLLLQDLPDQRQALIARLLVDEPVRGKGAGTGLLQAAQAWAINQGVHALLAHAPLRNVPGIAFYQRRGFRMCGLSERFYPTREDALLLGQTIA